MRLNWMNFRYWNYDGYGRFGTYFVRALASRGVDLRPMLVEDVTELPVWMGRMAGMDFSRLTIGCMPPHVMPHLPGRSWLFTMCEGTKLEENWAEYANSKAERLIVPCEHNAEAFRQSGVTIPIHVIPGGTSPEDFPVIHQNGRVRPYTFLALGDRGGRKGWIEVWQAFFQAFQGVEDVRLLIKARIGSNDLIDRIAGATTRDPRTSFWVSDVNSMYDVYSQVDCFAIPSRSEGWGMPHREAAMMGLPVIATRYSGLDDGNLDEWALPIDTFTLEDVPHYATHVRGKWAKPSIDEIADTMRWCYEHPLEARQKGQHAAAWLRGNQTWDHAACQLLELVERYI